LPNRPLPTPFWAAGPPPAQPMRSKATRAAQPPVTAPSRRKRKPTPEKKKTFAPCQGNRPERVARRRSRYSTNSRPIPCSFPRQTNQLWQFFFRSLGPTSGTSGKNPAKNPDGSLSIASPPPALFRFPAPLQQHAMPGRDITALLPFLAPFCEND